MATTDGPVDLSFAAPDAGWVEPVRCLGLAAGFQRGLAPFLQRYGPVLAGLTVVDRPEAFLAHVAASRPDYVVVSGPETDATLLRAMAEATRGAALAVASVGAPGAAAPRPGPILMDEVTINDTPARLALRMRALIRRCRPQALTGRRSWGALALDEACMTFSVSGRKVALRRELLTVLGAMMDAPDRVWQRADLHLLVFGQGSPNDMRAIDMRVSRTRRVVKAALGVDPVRTVRGVGYALVPDP